MTLAVGSNKGSGSSKDAGTDSVSPSFNAAVAVGKDLIIAAVRVPPNEDIVRDGDGIFIEELNDCVNHPTFSDDKGNTYSIIDSFYYTYPETPDPGGVLPRGGTLIGSLHVAKCRVTTALTTSDHFKVDWGVNGGARAVGSVDVQCSAGKTIAQTHGPFLGLDGTDTTPQPAISGASGFDAFLALLGLAGPSGDGYTAEGNPWIAISAPGTTGGAADSNATLRWSRRAAPPASDTFDPTLGTARKGLGLMIGLKEV